jgi:hypothetical protein
MPDIRELDASNKLDAEALRRILAQCKDSCEGSFVRIAGVKAVAHASGLTEREAMCALLDAGFWPERFRRSRSVLSAEGLKRLLRSRVFVAGCGGLGGHAAALLARSGVGSFVLCDPDIFEESNLNRQMFCTEATLGHPKAEVCREALLGMASHLEVDAHIVALDADNLPALLAGCTAVVDGLDSVPKKLMLEEAAADPDVLAIKQTLYRVSGNSPVVRALQRAARNGKQVTVVLELKARFDEENNIAWAQALDECGAHVVYGIAGLKIHAKALLIVRKEDGFLRRYCHLGTGNYNDRTALTY